MSLAYILSNCGINWIVGIHKDAARALKKLVGVRSVLTRLDNEWVRVGICTLIVALGVTSDMVTGLYTLRHLG